MSLPLSANVNVRAGLLERVGAGGRLVERRPVAQRLQAPVLLADGRGDRPAD